MPTTDPNRQEDRDGNELIVLPGKRLLDVEAYIAGDPQSGIQDGVQQQIQSHEHNPPNEIGPNEEARLWEDLKAETGYSSYSDYLCASEERLSYSLEFAGYRLHTRGSTKAEYASCVILDFSNGDDSRPRLSLRCSSSSGSVVLAALRQPSAGVAVRTVLWKTSELDEVMVNAIGLGFKIHPRFFHVLFATSGRLSSWGKEERLDERPLVPNIVVIENHVVAMARCSPPVYPDATPVILIASHSFGALTGKAHFDEVSHFRSAIVETLSRPLEGTPEWSVEYIRILQYDLEKERGSIGSDTNLLLRPLIPLLYFNIFRIRGECGLVREKYYKFIVPHDKFIASLGGVESRFPLGNPKNADRTSLEDLYELRVVLRRKIEDSEDNSEQLRRFLRSQRMLDVRQGKLFTMVEDDLQQVRLDAHRLETEIRDYLQLQTGVMAIHESRKSIELSNIQIEEGKRVKIFTILAFVYIPLNLATSIFGMNIKQLNGSGQHLRVFILTAVIMLAVTGGLWSVIEQVNGYFKWRKSGPDQPYNGKTQFALSVRLALLLCLVSNGRTNWMYRTGAWWRILTIHRSRIVSLYIPRGDNGRLNAGEHVSKYDIWGQFRGHIEGDKCMGHNSFRVEGTRWTSARGEDED